MINVIKELALVDYRSRFLKECQGSSPCLDCGGRGTVQGPIEYPDFDNALCCPHCESGRALATRLAETVAHTVRIDRGKN